MAGAIVRKLELMPASEESLHRGLAELTEAELRVLALMAEGLSNPGIADELVVGRRTVESHIATIFLKLSLWPEPNTNRRVRAILAYQRHFGAGIHHRLEAA